MKRRVFSLILAAALLLTGCASGDPAAKGEDGEDVLHIVATTYPVYLFVTAVTEGVEEIVVDRLNTGETSCLHDYTLSVHDMKLLDRADIIAMNGVGLEDFMADALAASDAAVIDCSEGVELLENLSHHHDEDDHSHDGHDHGHFDPHYWMDPANAMIMVENLRKELSALNRENAEIYRNNGLTASVLLRGWDSTARDALNVTRSGVPGFEITGLITFHDGFQYYARAYGLPLLRAIEEEAGSEASAHEIVEITELVKEKDIPVIFTEVSGSEATAKAIARETGCQVARLSMCMDGPDGQLSNYLDVLMNNTMSVVNGFAGEEIMS